MALVNQGRSDEAEKRARALLTVHSGAGMLWKVLGVALMRQGKDALQSLRRAAELMPDDGEAHNNLGAALHDREQWAEALPSLRRGLALQPDNFEALADAGDALLALGSAHEAVPMYQRALDIRSDARLFCNLAAAQTRLGLLNEAVTNYRRSIALNPRDVEALVNLASVLRDVGAAAEAASLCMRAIEMDPNRAESHYRLGNALFDLRKVDDAAASYSRALVLRARHAPAHLGLGVALRTLHRHDEAKASCQAALAIEPHCVEALSLLGELNADRGRFVEAETLFKRAIEIDRGFAFAFSSIATHRQMTNSDVEWLKGVETLLAKRLPASHEISLRYALGKYFDDVGRYDDAFAQYRRANELSKRPVSNYDKAKFTRRIDQIIRYFDASFIQRSRTRACTSELPVFIIGMPRSGTSLAEQILASHPAVFGAGEVVFWDSAFVAYRTQALESEAAGTALIPGMVREYLTRLTSACSAAQRVVDKMPANFLYAGFIHAALPHARIIHMRRHPVDTCLSIYFQNFMNRDPYANDLDDLAHYYGEYVRLTDHWRGLLPSATLMEVPYEGLIEEQESWTRRMLEFIGLPWNSKCLDFHQTDRSVITASKWQVRQKIHGRSAGRWRHYRPHLGPLHRLLDEGDREPP